MPITLTATQYEGTRLPKPIQKKFGKEGGKIGRSASNDLILPDRNHHVSRIHAGIDYRDDHYQFVQQGQNPTKVNGRTLEQGETATLASGDRLVIGPYTVFVEVEPEFVVPDATLFSRGPREPSGHIAKGTTSETLFSIPIKTHQPTHDPAPEPSFNYYQQDPKHSTTKRAEESAPQVKPGRDSMDSSSSERSLSIQSPVANPYEAPTSAVPEAFSGSAARIEGNSPISARSEAGRPPTQPFESGVFFSADADPESTINQLAFADKARPPAGASDHGDFAEQFLKAVGVDHIRSEIEPTPEFARRLGELVRELILGMHKVSRASFASTHSETNSQADPWSLHDSEEVLAWVLKNCSSPDENSQYLKPISSAYRVIENHARATEAGVRELAKAMIARLAPESLVQSEPTSRMYNLFPVLQRARLWNLARKRYDKLQRQWEAEVGPELVKIFFDAYQAEQKDTH